MSLVLGALLGTGWMVAAGAVVAGLRQRHAYREAVAENAARRHSERCERDQRTELLERVRVARELHDIVAHHMAVVSVQAGLARYVLASDPDTAERSLQVIAELSREAWEEVRRLVSVLHPDPDRPRAGETGDQDTPGIDELPTMIERVGLGGVAIEFDVAGEALALRAGVGLCLYRVIQESIMHARGARVTVSLRYSPGQVTARIRTARPATGSPDGAAARRPGPRDGTGLARMYERVLLYGGTLTAGGNEPDGFEVILTLPVGTTAADLAVRAGDATVGGGRSGHRS